MPQGTGIVDYNSELVRKQWMKEGLIQSYSKSFWAPYTGLTKESVIFQTNDASAADGHTVVFDFDGNLAGRGYKGKETAFGKGEQKKKFSDKVTVERYRYPVDNGDKFDGVNIGDLSINQHEDSRTKLSDLWVRIKDQAIFDTAQGFYKSDTPSHTIQIDASSTALTYQDLADIELILRTGTGYKTGAFGSSTAATSRAPLVPFRLADGRSMWLFIIDPFTANNLKSNSTSSQGIMALAQHADLRGNDNRVFRGLIGTIGQLAIIEAESFFGESVGTDLNESKIEICGMRNWDATNSKWSGQSGYVPGAASFYSRNLIMGQSAIQLAFGKQPDYKWQESEDFGIKSESALEVWYETKKTNLTAENEDYSSAKRADLDHGVIAVDVKIN